MSITITKEHEIIEQALSKLEKVEGDIEAKVQFTITEGKAQAIVFMIGQIKKEIANRLIGAARDALLSQLTQLLDKEADKKR